MLSVTIPIKGMSCGGCVTNVRNALLKTTGVIDSQVRIGLATVTYDPAVTKPSALRDAITGAGYAPAAEPFSSSLKSE